MQKKPRIYLTEEQVKLIESTLGLKEIPEFPNYYVTSKSGIILHKGDWNKGKWMKMRTPLNNCTYRQVCLRKPNDPTPYTMAVSRAVALAWCEGRTKERNEVMHINEDGRFGIESADDAINLAWGTKSENHLSPMYRKKNSEKMMKKWSNKKWANRQIELIRKGFAKKRVENEWLIEHPLF